MKDGRVARDGLVLLGCGKMGSAMLEGWLAKGLPASAVWVVDPKPSDWLQGTGVNLNADLPAAPAVVLVAVKVIQQTNEVVEQDQHHHGHHRLRTILVTL